MRAGDFAASLSEPSRQALYSLGGLRTRHAHIKSAERFEAFSAANRSAADIALRRLDHNVINVL
jgi:hypothetical protein